MPTYSARRLVEIRPETADALIVELFRQSEREMIVLVLNGTTPRRIDAVLDPVARTVAATIPGLRYVDIANEASIAEHLATARAVVAASEGFRSLVVRLGYVTGPLHDPVALPAAVPVLAVAQPFAELMDTPSS